MGRCESCEDGACALEEPIYMLASEEKAEFKALWAHLESAQSLLKALVEANIRYEAIKTIMTKRLKLLTSILEEKRETKPNLQNPIDFNCPDCGSPLKRTRYKSRLAYECQNESCNVITVVYKYSTGQCREPVGIRRIIRATTNSGQVRKT